ncbi:MAG: YfhO family protein [Ignavibacteria bacterium]
MPKANGNSSKAASNSSFLFIPERYRDLSFILALMASVILFLSPALFTGGNFNASDNIASASFETFLNEAKEQGEFPQWLPYIFSGLPSYAALLTTGERSWDFLATLYFGAAKLFAGIFNNDAARIAFHYMVYAIGMYLLMRSKGKERFIAFAVGFAAVFSTFIITWIMIGHNTKPIALAMFPFILLFLERLRSGWSLFHASALIIAVHVLVESTHVQMAYYGVITFALYLIATAISSIVKKESLLGVARSTFALMLAGGLAFGMSADRYLSVLEYKPYSTRGSAPIEQLAGNKQDNTGGFDYDYATNWSFSPEETLTFLVPNYFGFGKLEYKPKGATQGQIVQPYWGQMPFTDAANYMGIGVLALALLGIYAFRKEIFIHYLIVLSLLSLFLSFGKNFPLIFDIFYYNLPGFNNFRAPMMALCVMQFAIPILFGYGLSALNDWRNQSWSQSKNPMLVIFGGMVLLLLSGFLISESGYIADVQAANKVPEQLFEFLYEQMKADWMITSFIGIAVISLSILYIRGALSKGLFYTAIAIYLIIDLWRVAYRPMEVEKGDIIKSEFSEPEFVSFIKKDKSLYRVADLVYMSMGKTNIPAYFKLQNVHGYHSAKMRVYQDLLDVAGGGGGNYITNLFLMNLLNVKYISAPQQMIQGVKPVFEGVMQTDQGAMPTLVYENASVLPRAFFVDSVKKDTPLSILHHLRDGDFNPKSHAFIEKDLATNIEPAGINAKATVTGFENHKITISTDNPGTNFLHVSEVYLPVGWSCTIDGKPTEIYKTNYALRGIIVPSGKHTVVFTYHSDIFDMGKTISLSVNIATTLSLLLAFFLQRRNKNNDDTHDAKSTS